jgi:hypothetical protein
LLCFPVCLHIDLTEGKTGVTKGEQLPEVPYYIMLGINSLQTMRSMERGILLAIEHCTL